MLGMKVGSRDNLGQHFITVNNQKGALSRWKTRFSINRRQNKMSVSRQYTAQKPQRKDASGRCYSPQKWDDELHQLSLRNHFLVEKVQAPQEVFISLWAPQGLPHLREETSVTTRGSKHPCAWERLRRGRPRTDLLKEHGFSAGAVFAHLGHAVIFPHDFGFLLQK